MECPDSASDFDVLLNRIESPGLLALAQHWRLVRRDRRMPSWSDLSPSAVAPYLTQLWAFKHDRESGEFVGKLAGNRIMAVAGQGFRGIPLRALYPPHTYETARAALKRAVSEPAAYRCRGALFRIGDKVVEGERLVLPLATDGVRGDAVIGASDYAMPTVTGALEVLVGDPEWFSL